MYSNPYISRVCNTAKVGIKMHALSYCFISAACSTENSNFFIHLFVYFSSYEIVYYVQITCCFNFALAGYHGSWAITKWKVGKNSNCSLTLSRVQWSGEMQYKAFLWHHALHHLSTMVCPLFKWSCACSILSNGDHSNGHMNIRGRIWLHFWGFSILW